MGVLGIVSSLPESVHLRTQASGESARGGGEGGCTWPIFGYGWAAEGLKPWPCLEQKKFSNTYLVWDNPGGKSHCFVYLDYEQNSSSKSYQSVQAIPCWQTHTELYTLFRTDSNDIIHPV